MTFIADSYGWPSDQLTPRVQKKRRAGIVESLTADARKEAKEAADEAARKRKADELALKQASLSPAQQKKAQELERQRQQRKGQKTIRR